MKPTLVLLKPSMSCGPGFNLDIIERIELVDQRFMY